MRFEVFEGDKDVTGTHDWYIGVDGTLYYETNDIDCPLQEAKGYRYEITHEMGERQRGKANE